MFLQFMTIGWSSAEYMAYKMDPDQTLLKLHTLSSMVCIRIYAADIIANKNSCFLFVCLIWFYTSHPQSFSYVGTGLPGLNQY